ncbi:MAG: TrmB family transcriptional regulator [Nitrososphaerales archaeon]
MPVDKTMMERTRNDLIKDLVSYGLTPVQAQAYLTLLKLGSATAKSISGSSDINRVDIYRALRHLKKFGLVEEKLSNPTEFVAVEPDQALDILIASKLRVIDRLSSSRTELGGRLHDFKMEFSGYGTSDKESDENDMFLKVVWGEQMFRRVQSVVLGSKKEIITIFAPSVMIIYDQMGIPDLEAERRRNNVNIRALTNIIPDNLNQARVYSKIVDLRHNDLQTSQLRYTIVDDEKLVLPVGERPNSINEGTALWTNSRVLISALKADFEALWQNSIPASERIKQLLALQSA